MQGLLFRATESECHGEVRRMSFHNKNVQTLLVLSTPARFKVPDIPYVKIFGPHFMSRIDLRLFESKVGDCIQHILYLPGQGGAAEPDASDTGWHLEFVIKRRSKRFCLVSCLYRLPNLIFLLTGSKELITTWDKLSNLSTHNGKLTLSKHSLLSLFWNH